MSAPANRVPTLAPPRLGARHFAALIGLVVAALAAGFALRAGTREEAPAPPPAPRVVDAGPVALSVPAAWTPERIDLAGIPGFARPAAAFTPLPGLRAHAVIGLAPIDDRSLVAAPLRAIDGAPLGRPRRTSLAGLPAWSYPERPISGGRVLQVTVAPTTAGVVTVACVAESASWPGAGGCAGDVTGASLAGASPLEPERELAFRTVLPGIMDRLVERRGALRSRLRGAETRREQARFASRLDRAHVRALVTLAPWTARTGATRRIERALRSGARSYRRLAAAARGGWPKRYRQARRAVRGSDAALRRSLAAVGRP